MANVWLPSVVGGLSGVIAATVGVAFNSKRTAAEASKLQAEAEKVRAETREIELRMERAGDEVREQVEEIRSRAENVEATIAYDRARPRTKVIYDSSPEGFGVSEFSLTYFDEAEAELRVATHEAPDDELCLIRRNNLGRVYIWLRRYSYPGTPDVIPVGNAIAERRTLRVTCEVRSAGALRTVLFVLKQLGAPPGDYLASRRVRLTSEAWTPVDAAFEVTPTGDFRFRVEDRSVSEPVSKLTVRKLTITERDTPESVIS